MNFLLQKSNQVTAKIISDTYGGIVTYAFLDADLNEAYASLSDCFDKLTNLI